MRAFSLRSAVTWVVCMVLARSAAFFCFRVASGFASTLVEQAWPPALVLGVMGAFEGLIYGSAVLLAFRLRCVRASGWLLGATVLFFVLGWVVLSLLSPEDSDALVFGAGFGAAFGLGLGFVQQHAEARLGRDFFARSALGWGSAMLLAAIAREQVPFVECFVDCILAGTALGLTTVPDFFLRSFFKKDGEVSISPDLQT